MSTVDRIVPVFLLYWLWVPHTGGLKQKWLMRSRGATGCPNTRLDVLQTAQLTNSPRDMRDNYRTCNRREGLQMKRSPSSVSTATAFYSVSFIHRQRRRDRLFRKNPARMQPMGTPALGSSNVTRLFLFLGGQNILGEANEPTRGLTGRTCTLH